MRTCLWKFAITTTIVFLLLGTVSMAVAQTEYMKKFKGTKLRVLAVEMPMLKIYWKMIPEFEKKYGIKVELDENPFDQYREKTLVDMSKHTGRYDAINIDCMWLAELAAAKYLEPLMKYITNPDYCPRSDCL